jgi:hypothetical protein
MKPKKYSTLYANLSSLILSMPERQQAKLLDLATRMQKGENFNANNGTNRNHIWRILNYAPGKANQKKAT